MSWCSCPTLGGSPKWIMLADESSFLPFRAHNAQVVRHAIRSERHYAASGDMFAAGTALRYALEEFLHAFVRSEASAEEIEEGERGLAKLIDNHWAPRAGHHSMHEIRMLGNRAAHTGEPEPLPTEILDALRSFWGILRNYFGSDSGLRPKYLDPVRRVGFATQPAPVGRKGETPRELEQKIEVLTKERRTQEDQLVILKRKEEDKQRKLEEAEHDLYQLQQELTATKQDSRQIQDLQAKVNEVSRERDELAKQGAKDAKEHLERDAELKRANDQLSRLKDELHAASGEVEKASGLDARLRVLKRERDDLANERDELARRSERDSKARKELDDRLVAAEKELSEMLDIREWTADFPHNDWSQVPEYLLGRLEKGLPPFQEWHAPPRLIGEGGFGRVYRCYPSNDGVPVAVKIPWAKGGNRKALQGAWEGECRSARDVAYQLASNTSITVPKPLQIAPEGIDAFVVYEFVEGRELGETIALARKEKDDGRMSAIQALFIADHLAGTVDQLLQFGVRHTDLQPRNVILRKPHEPVLIDYAPCLPGDRRPPEWRGKDPQQCEVEVVRSGQIHLLAILLAQMLGVVPRTRRELSESIPFLDDDLEPAVPKDVWEENLNAELQGNLDTLEVEVRDELIALMLDALDENCASRMHMRVSAFRRSLRKAYDPSGLIGAILPPT